jgi:hypothetical protein
MAMWIEPLESRRLLSATAIAAAAAQTNESLATRAAFHTRKADLLSRNIVGTYGGFYRLGNAIAGNEVMTISSQTPKSFTGTLSFDDGPAVPFVAKLSPRAQVPSLGFGYKFTFPFKSGTTKLQLKGEFQLGANGFIVQMTGKFNGHKVPKPHGELNLSPDNPSTFLR